jgi:hypothetical protein
LRLLRSFTAKSAIIGACNSCSALASRVSRISMAEFKIGPNSTDRTDFVPILNRFSGCRAPTGPISVIFGPMLGADSGCGLVPSLDPSDSMAGDV